MKRILNNIKATLFRLFKRRLFLIRLLITSLLAVLIPLSVMSVRQINKENNQINKLIQLQLDNTASAVANHLDNFHTRMISVCIKLMLNAKLHENVLTKGIQYQIDALEAIEYYSIAIPFVKDYALFFPQKEEAYTLSGKYMQNGFIRYFLEVSESDFKSMLNDFSSQPGFMAHPSGNGNILFIFPIHTYIGSSRTISRYVIFLITPSSLLNNMRHELPSGYRLARITRNHKLIYNDPFQYRNYEDSDENEWIISSITSFRGFTVTVQMTKSELLHNIESITLNVKRLSLFGVAVCVVLMVMVVFLNYRPLAKIVKRFTSGDVTTATSELESLSATYARLLNDKGKLTWQLYEKDLMYADRIMENLLNGQKVSSSDIKLLKLDMPFIRVVCAPLKDVKNTTEIIERNVIGSPIYAIEMYDDGRLVFVCSQPNNTHESLSLLTDTLRKLVKADNVLLGFSTSYNSLEFLYSAYLEANKALASPSLSNNHYAAEIKTQELSLLEEDPYVIKTLTHAIKAGETYMIEFAVSAFEQIFKAHSQEAEKHYACYQLLDLYKRLGENVGIEIDLAQYTEILQESKLDVLQERFIEVLTEQLNQRKLVVSSTSNSLSTDLLMFIKNNHCDPMFSMNEVADHLGVSIYTASRMLKTLTNTNFRKYLNDIRIEHACHLLLSTNLTIRDVSEQVGFTSTSYFIHIFKTTVGKTPAMFRKQES
ncbi:MAG: helix-turn-helix domain-containing protein [Christensenellales bacterium]|jgi:AraC-like DNA-binding protein